MTTTQTVFVALLRLRLTFFLSVLWLRAFLAGFNLSCFVLHLYVPPCCVVMFSLASLHLNLLWFLVFLFTCLIWSSISCGGCNDYRFCDVQPGALPVIEVIKARAKCHLCILFKRFGSSRRQQYFHRQWGASGVVGRVSEGLFYFRL